MYVSERQEASEYWTVLNLPVSQDTHKRWIPADLVMSSSSGPCHLIPLILLITCRVCVCSEKEDSVAISDMDLAYVLQKGQLKISTEQSPLLSMDKMYPFRQMLANSLNTAKTSMCEAHEISCTSDSWLQAPKQEHSETFDISLQCSSVFTSRGFSFDIRQPDNSQKHQQCLQSISEESLLMALTICRGAGKTITHLLLALQSKIWQYSPQLNYIIPFVSSKLGQHGQLVSKPLTIVRLTAKTVYIFLALLKNVLPTMLWILIQMQLIREAFNVPTV